MAPDIPAQPEEYSGILSACGERSPGEVTLQHMGLPRVGIQIPSPG